MSSSTERSSSSTVGQVLTRMAEHGGEPAAGTSAVVVVLGVVLALVGIGAVIMVELLRMIMLGARRRARLAPLNTDAPFRSLCVSVESSASARAASVQEGTK